MSKYSVAVKPFPYMVDNSLVNFGTYNSSITDKLYHLHIDTPEFNFKLSCSKLGDMVTIDHICKVTIESCPFILNEVGMLVMADSTTEAVKTTKDYAIRVSSLWLYFFEFD